MSTAVVPYGELERMASAFATSNMFGAKTKEQALSLLLLAQAEGVHPAIAMRDFDIIQGRPAKKAEAMHRSFIAAGGRVEWHALTDEQADATFSHPQGGTVRVTWDMARAKKAGIGGKDMYSKYPRQMLKSRVISEGCRTVYPAATSGLYVPDEVVTFKPVQPQAQPERDMGAAQIVHDEDITQQIPGAGKVSAAPQAPPTSPSASPATPAEPADLQHISTDQASILRAEFVHCDKYAEEKFLEIAKIEKLEMLPASDYDEALDWIRRRKAKFSKA